MPGADGRFGACRRAHEAGCPRVCDHTGAPGALVFDGRTLHPVAAVPTRAVDTVGAGDMFAGAFLYGITHGMSYPQAGGLAAAAAARLVASLGPRLKVDETRAVLRHFLETNDPAGK